MCVVSVYARVRLCQPGEGLRRLLNRDGVALVAKVETRVALKHRHIEAACKLQCPRSCESSDAAPYDADPN